MLGGWDGEAGDWRNPISRAMDGKNTFTVSLHEILRLRSASRGMTEGMLRFTRNHMKAGAPK